MVNNMEVAHSDTNTKRNAMTIVKTLKNQQRDASNISYHHTFSINLYRFKNTNQKDHLLGEE